MTDKSHHVFFRFEISEKMMHNSNIIHMLHMIVYFHNFVVSMFEFCWRKVPSKETVILYLFISPALALVAYLLEVGCCASVLWIFHDGFPMVSECFVDLRMYYIRNSHPCGWIYHSHGVYRTRGEYVSWNGWIYHSHGSVMGGLECQKVSSPPGNWQQNAPEKSVVRRRAFQGTC